MVTLQFVLNIEMVDLICGFCFDKVNPLNEDHTILLKNQTTTIICKKKGI